MNEADSPKEFIKRYEIVLLDMGGTFMFECGRFGDPEAVFGTYRGLGGRRLTRDQVGRLMLDLSGAMRESYENPANWENFGKVKDFLGGISGAKDLPETELEILEEVEARHEMGNVPPGHVLALRRLAASYRLGLVSNIWAESRWYREYLKEIGVAGLFEILVFSADHGVLKPSRKLFDPAIDHFGGERTRMVYVGNRIKRDVVGARNAGLDAIWINAAGEVPDPEGPRPDLEVRDLTELA